MKSLLRLHKKVDGIINTSTERKDSSTENYSTPKINKSETGAKWTDKAIAIGTIALAIATIFLAIYTFALFREAVNAGVSQHEIHIADSINSERRFKLDSTNLAEQIRISNDNVQAAKEANKLSDSISKVTFAQQINSLKETQKEFRKANEPYLQIQGIEDSVFALGQKIRMKVFVENIGNYPAKITAISTNVSVETSNPIIEDLQKFDNGNKNRLNKYLSKDEVFTLLVASDNSVSIQDYDLVKRGNGFIYYYGYCEYQDLVTGRTRLYRFMIRYKPFPSTYLDYIISDNFDYNK